MGTRNVRTAQYKALLAALSERIRLAAEGAFRVFLNHPNHPALRLHKLEDTHRSQHRPGSYSVPVTMKYRAIYAMDDDVNVWYWIGSHACYDAYVDG